MIHHSRDSFVAMRSLVFVVLVASCAGPDRSAAPPVATPPAPSASPSSAAAPAVEKTTLAAVGVDPTWMDRSADPCDDLYRFACGGFLDHAEIPADLSSWRPATQIRKANEDFLHQTLEQARGAPASDPVLGRLGAFYGACMDEAAIEKAGLAPVAPLLDAAAAVHDERSLADAVIALHQASIPAYFGLYGLQDHKDSQRIIGWIYESGLGL